MKILKYKEFQLVQLQTIDSENLIHVQQIIENVKKKGDRALQQYTLKYDNVHLDSFAIDNQTMCRALTDLDKPTLHALQQSARRLELFSRKQLSQLKDFEMEISPGVFTGQRVIPLKRVGIYVPGGNFPLVSSLIMGAVPARAAGVKEIVVCTPPDVSGKIHPAMMAAGVIAGVDEVYSVGGVQAIAAMAYGTESIKPVDKIVGPGNRFVSAAKKVVYGQVGIDFIAGPSEIFIIADDSANPSWIAADLLAQAEHDHMAIPTLATPSPELANQVQWEIKNQLEQLRTRDIAEISINKNGKIILVETLDEAVEMANHQAPEHLELHIAKPDLYQEKLYNFGSLFIGGHAAEVLGDYSAGINHTLPTARAARYTGGLSSKDFVKLTTTLRITGNSFDKINQEAMILAKIEGLSGHEQAAGIRLKT